MLTAAAFTLASKTRECPRCSPPVTAELKLRVGGFISIPIKAVKFFTKCGKGVQSGVKDACRRKNISAKVCVCVCVGREEMRGLP